MRAERQWRSFPDLRRGALWAFTITVLAFLIAPLLAIIPLSFNSGEYLTYPLEGFSLRWYAALGASDDWMLALKNSLIVGISATGIASVLGTLAALGLNDERFPLKALVMGVIISPMIVPIVIIAVGLYYFFAPLGLTQSYTGLILAHAMLGAPLVVITVSAALANFNTNLIRAASSLGAGPLRTLVKVILPLILPGVVSGAVLAFATSLDEVVVVIFLAGSEQRTLPRQMLSGIRDYISPTIMAVATLLIAISVLLLAAIEVLRRRADTLGTFDQSGRPPQ